MASIKYLIFCSITLFMPYSIIAQIGKKPPDIVIIIADDIGYSDIGCYGGEIPTPNIDRLASRGILFTQFYAENMCVASRAALLTGQYHLSGFDKGKNITIAEGLSQGSYKNFAVGKWHNYGEGFKDHSERSAPLERGFDHFYGTPIGAGSFFAPLKLSRDGAPAENEWKENDGFYYTDAISQNAVHYINETSKDASLFLYVAYTAGHWPLHALPEDIAEQKGRYSMGWDSLRHQRLERMKALGIIDEHTPLSPRHPMVPSWEQEENKEWQERRMEVYAAQISRMDQGIGSIVKALEAAGRLDNTLLMFMVDNGGCHVEYLPDRTGDFLNKETREGQPITTGNLPLVMPGPEETWQSYGHGWANASNTPFRLFKQYSHEGGIKVPLIVQWPSVIEKGDQISHELTHIIDILPTMLDAADVEYPQAFENRQIDPMDGKSLMPLLQGAAFEGHDYLCWSHAHGKAIRQENWKLVKHEEAPWELYDLEKDPIETENLSEDHPDKVHHLSQLFNEWFNSK
jgi:arylsulfatase